jgi:hypothetical protein
MRLELRPEVREREANFADDVRVWMSLGRGAIPPQSVYETN